MRESLGPDISNFFSLGRPRGGEGWREGFVFSKKKIGLSSLDYACGMTCFACSLIDVGYSHGCGFVKPVADVNKAYNTKCDCYVESTEVVKNNVLI